MASPFGVASAAAFGRCRRHLEDLKWLATMLAPLPHLRSLELVVAHDASGFEALARLDSLQQLRVTMAPAPSAAAAAALQWACAADAAAAVAAAKATYVARGPSLGGLCYISLTSLSLRSLPGTVRDLGFAKGLYQLMSLDLAWAQPPVFVPAVDGHVLKCSVHGHDFFDMTGIDSYSPEGVPVCYSINVLHTLPYLPCLTDLALGNAALYVLQVGAAEQLGGVHGQPRG